MTNEAKPQLDITTEISAIREMYSKQNTAQLICALVLGATGSGKTTLIETCRRPIHIDSFDPKGTSPLKKGIKEGWIIADTQFENEDPKDAHVFYDWDEAYERRREGGYFEQMGTYVLDGLTLWSEAIMNVVLKGIQRKADRHTTRNTEKGKIVAIETDYLKIPQENDWPLQMAIIKNALLDIITLPCDVIVIGHSEDKKDKQGNVLSTGLYITGKLATRIPRWFEEIYIMKREEKSAGAVFKLHTSRTDRVDARTRLGRGVFQDVEEPNIMALLRKAGLNPQHKDMPWLKQ